ncbi:MalY/PatB family protein [Lysinibacillus sp. 54212]|uniref:MalY/PatB family protein n=1 Tax=Lysinibacillus sp. 54212 TaxID=3119829 RepID=UPI002FCC8521
MSIFNKVLERKNTNSLKWDLMEKIYGIEDASELLPMWVADMDFAPPKEVVQAIEKRLSHPIFGYSYVCDDCKGAIVDWFKRRHSLTINPETILFQQGVVPAIASIIETFTEPGDRVAISTPVYPPFFTVPRNQKRELISCDLNENNGIYSYDFEALEEVFKQGVKIYILCNPHNPGGIVWDRTTLERLVELCIQYDVLIISDEIHADIVLEGAKYTPLSTVARADEANILTLIAPTKTFNLAGIQAAVIVAPKDDLRLQLQQNELAHGQIELNVFASPAVHAAYTYGDAWLDELLDYLSTNMDYVIRELTSLQGITIIKPQGTYLLWIDYRETGLEEKEIMDKLLRIGKLALEPGSKYGEAGQGFLRMNVACPFDTVKEGVERFKKALQ